MKLWQCTVAPVRRLTLVLVLALLWPGTAGASAEPAGGPLPPGFHDRLVADDLGLPVGLAFTPDGRLLATTKDGLVWVVRDGVLVPEPALDLRAVVCTDRERGMVGVAVDPAFAANRSIYLYYTFRGDTACGMGVTGARNRVSRFQLGDDDVVDPASERVILDGIPSPKAIHNGGDLQFRHGLLYVSVGDGSCDIAGGGCGVQNTAAHDLNVLSGKILRVTRKGSIPPGNPYTGAGTARCNGPGFIDEGMACQEIYASGLRNPFRIAFDPNGSGRLFANDVGLSTWEEIDDIAVANDYGWPTREGFCATGSTTDCGPAPPGLTNPVAAYGRDDGCGVITGGAFVPDGAWPPEYDGTYLFADIRCARFSLLTGGVISGFAAASRGSPLHLVFGPDGSCYYSTFSGGGQIRKLQPPA